MPPLRLLGDDLFRRTVERDVAAADANFLGLSSKVLLDVHLQIDVELAAVFK